MKKVLSVLAVVALVFALSVSAFADGEAVASVQYTTPDVKTADVPEGTMVNVTEAEALDAAEEAALSEAVKEFSTEGVAAEIFEVDLLEGKPGDEMMGLVSDQVTAENPITVVFVRSEDDAEIIGVLAQNAEGGWDKMAFETVEGGVSVTFTHLCTVAFLTAVEADEPDDTDNEPKGDEPTNTGDEPTNTGDNTNGGNTNGGSTNGGNTPSVQPGGQKSPATGYNTTVWVVMTAVLVLAAGVCFVSARKKVEE